MQVKKIKMLTKDKTERNSEELINFYNAKVELEGLEFELQEADVENIDVEFYGYSEELETNQSDELTLLDKIGIPYDQDVYI